MSASASNFISEWYGVRLYPSASGAGASDAVELFRNRRCPFLSSALEDRLLAPRTVTVPGFVP